MTEKRYRSLMLNALRVQSDRTGTPISKLPPETLRRFGVAARAVDDKPGSPVTFDVEIPKDLPGDFEVPEQWLVVRHIEDRGPDGKASRLKAAEPLEEDAREAAMTGREARKMLGQG